MGRKDQTSPNKNKITLLNACFEFQEFWVGFHSKHNPRTQGNSYSRTWYIHISIFPASGFVYVSDYISPYKKPLVVYYQNRSTNPLRFSEISPPVVLADLVSSFPSGNSHRPRVGYSASESYKHVVLYLADHLGNWLLGR